MYPSIENNIQKNPQPSQNFESQIAVQLSCKTLRGTPLKAAVQAEFVYRLLYHLFIISPLLISLLYFWEDSSFFFCISLSHNTFVISDKK